MDVMITLEKQSTKTCYRCKEVKDIDMFGIANRTKDGLKIWCKTCCKDYNADFHYRKKYGLSTAQVIQMHEERDYKCDICNGNQPPRKVGKTSYISDTMAIDHCHKSGKIRGLLCHVCNTFLGAVKDDTRILKKMINYLERNN